MKNDKELNQLLYKAKEVTLVGYYGAGNYGDDLILKALVKNIQKHNLKINLIGHGEINFININGNIGFWKEKSKMNNFKMFKEISKNSDIIIWGGGTCFTDEDGDGLFKYMMYSKFIKMKKIAYLSVGIGNLRRIRSKIKTALLINSSNYISLRENKSYLIAKKIKKFNQKNIKKSKDLASNIISEYISEKNNIENRLLISWRNLENYKEKNININKVIEWCKKFCEKNFITNILIIDADSAVDEKINSEIEKIMKEKLPNYLIKYEKDKSINDKLVLISESRYILTSRLHIAMSTNFKKSICYLYNYSPKMEYFYQENLSQNLYLLDNKDLI